MTDTSQGPGWWLASDGRWYPPQPVGEMHDFDDGNGPVPAHRHPNGGGWVADTATVAKTAFVGPDAAVFQFAQVHDFAVVTDTCWVLGSARISDHARIAGDAEVNGNAQVADDAQVTGSAFVTDDARVVGNSQVGGASKCLEQCTISGGAKVFGEAVISGDVVFTGDNRVFHQEGEANPPRASEPRPGWWLAADGSWYPPPEPATHEVPDDARRNGHRLLYTVATLMVLGLAVALLVGILSSSDSTPTGPSLSDLTTNAQDQITGSGPGNFAVTGVNSVVCNPPKSWSPGETFTCFAYASDGTGIGTYSGTVEPNSSSGSYRWNATWLP